MKLKMPAKTVYPERRVIKAGVSPMNPKVKWAQLDCGHDVFRQRKPRIGALIVCERCRDKIMAGAHKGA